MIETYILHIMIASAEARTISYAKASFWDRMGNGFSEMVQMEILLGFLSESKSRSMLSAAMTKKKCFEKTFFFSWRKIILNIWILHVKFYCIVDVSKTLLKPKLNELSTENYYHS